MEQSDLERMERLQERWVEVQAEAKKLLGDGEPTATQQKKAIAECLESLEELGILASHDEEGVTRWYFAELQKAG